MRNERYLCICADDFGLSEGINAAALELADREKLSAIGCMVRRPLWHIGSRDLRHLDAGRVDVGLHLDLEFPPVPGGGDRHLVSLIGLAYLRLLRGNRLRDEIRFQLNSFEDRMGRAPAFIDGHRHVHQLPGVRDVLIAETMSRYRAAPPWLRNTAPAERRWLPRSKTDIKANVIHALGGRELNRLADLYGIPISRSLLGVYTFPGSDVDYQSAFSKWVEQCRNGDVLMCHPSLGGLPAAPHDHSRRREYLALRALDLATLHATAGIIVAPLSRVFCPTAITSARPGDLADSRAAHRKALEGEAD
ncbi:MAG: hypothetical protein JWQ73_3508 [Variovorax sp.]|nr:hypothetical protein [Variovorax sp.]